MSEIELQTATTDKENLLAMPKHCANIHKETELCSSELTYGYVCISFTGKSKTMKSQKRLEVVVTQMSTKELM